MSITFQSSELQSLYLNGSNPTSLLASFRNAVGNAELKSDIENLDRRIAQFEAVLISPAANNSGFATGEYPYDREGLKREFLDELLGLLIRASGSADGTTSYSSTYTAEDVAAKLPFPIRGTNYYYVVRNSATGMANFSNLDTSGGTTQRQALLSASGKDIFESYERLIDQVFLEGDKLRDNPSRPVQVVTKVETITINGLSYSLMALESDISEPTTKLKTYLVEPGTENSRVVKADNGDATLSGPATTNKERLLLEPVEGIRKEFSSGVVTIDDETIRLVRTTAGYTIRNEADDAQLPATAIKPFRMNLPSREEEFPEVHLEVTHLATTQAGTPYLIGLGTDGASYVINVSAQRRSRMEEVASLSAIEYLYYFNEARIKILRAKLAYQEAVVREIQDDLRKANDALSELEVQAGAITPTDKDGQPTGQLSIETLKMSVFNAVHSAPGNALFTTGPVYTSTTWQENRTNLKNYIDRRSAEAQQATLDYQNVLNRYNNAFEVMGKLQEKLDTLLKSQIRNMA